MKCTLPIYENYGCTFYIDTKRSMHSIINILKKYMNNYVQKKDWHIIGPLLDIYIEDNDEYDDYFIEDEDGWQYVFYYLEITPSNKEEETFDLDLYIRELRRLCEFLESHNIAVAMSNHFGDFDIESEERDEGWSERVKLLRKKAKEDVSCCFFFDTILIKDDLINIISKRFPLNQPYNIVGDTTLNITFHENENYNEKLIKYDGGWRYSRYCFNIKPIDKDYKIYDRQTCINEIIRLADYLEAHNIPTVITGMFGDEINADYRFNTWKERREKLITRAKVSR